MIIRAFMYIKSKSRYIKIFPEIIANRWNFQKFSMGHCCLNMLTFSWNSCLSKFMLVSGDKVFKNYRCLLNKLRTYVFMDKMNHIEKLHSWKIRPQQTYQLRMAPPAHFWQTFHLRPSIYVGWKCLRRVICCKLLSLLFFFFNSSGIIVRWRFPTFFMPTAILHSTK